MFHMEKRARNTLIIIIIIIITVKGCQISSLVTYDVASLLIADGDSAMPVVAQHTFNPFCICFLC